MFFFFVCVCVFTNAKKQHWIDWKDIYNVLIAMITDYF